jgi:hypothetical protein
VQETTGIRELTVEELDLVTGGFGMDWYETTRLSISITAVGAAVLGLIDWLFG